MENGRADRAVDALEVDAVVVGAGVGGLYALHRLRVLGFSAVGIEAGDGVGGTWYWNRYPGCRCDVPTLEYSYSFDEQLEQEWSFPEMMSAQPDIEVYLNHVADRFDLRRDIRFSTRVTSATWDDHAGRWIVETDHGDRYVTTWCVMATGALSAPNLPLIPGIETFAGTTVHTGLWPREGVDLEGRRVGIIGTGSSGMQSIPHLGRAASHLTVFQRTPNYAFPADIEPVDPEIEAYVKANYRELRRLQRHSVAGASTMRLPDGDGSRLALGAGALAILNDVPRTEDGGIDPAVLAEVFARMESEFADMVRGRVHDPEIAEALIPKDYHLGCKRLVIEVDYFETYNRDNVTLVDLRKEPIVEVTPTSIRTSGREVEIDVLVLATGFDALTGPLSRIEVRGCGGRLLADEWRDGPQAYLGLMVAGFPNLFAITGPGSPSVLSNMVVSIEQHVDWATDAMVRHRAGGIGVMDARPDAQAEWMAHVQEVAAFSPYTAPSCNSWYVGANIEGKARAILPYTGGVGTYRKRCDEVAATGYAGFDLRPAPAAQSG
jgi:cyclohexanone monooxygenase